MRIGSMRHFVELQKPAYADGPGGKQNITWHRVKDLYVSMDGIGSEQVTGEQTQARVLWTMQTHADSELKPNRRLVMGTRVFDIISVVPAKADVDVFVDITASEIVE